MAPLLHRAAIKNKELEDVQSSNLGKDATLRASTKCGSDNKCL